jgi:glycerophosphoryl diester phosphodiesterase
MFFDHLPQQGFICAHRGARSIAPENTLLSLDKAMKCGAHCWETDVQITRDKELIIFHDSNLSRTTNIATHEMFCTRKEDRVEQFTLEELRKLDAGSWFLADDPFGTVAGGEVQNSERDTVSKQQIPLLREVLHFSKEHSFPVNIEIKSLDTPQGDVEIVDRTIEMIKETGTLDLVLLSSFRHEYLHRARALSGDIAIAVLAKNQHPENLIQYLQSFSAAAYHPGDSICDTETILELQKSGFRVNSWTINNRKRAEELHIAGVGIITDWPQNLLTLPEKE